MESDTYYFVHFSPPLDPSRARWILCTSYGPSSSGSIFTLSSNLPLDIESGLNFSSYPTEILHEIIISPIRAISPASFIIFVLNTLIMFDKQNKCSTRHAVLKYCPPITFMCREKHVSYFYITDTITVLYLPHSNLYTSVRIREQQQ